MNLRLDLTNARETGHSAARNFEFETGPVTLGRSSQCRVVLEGDMISRTHLVLDLVHDTWQVTHQGRLTPTLLNGAPIPHGQPRRLNDGDVMTVGDYTIRASYGRETRLPDLEPMRDSGADMTMDRASVMTQVAGDPRGARGTAPTFIAAPGPAGRVVPTLVVSGNETSRLELREVERAYVIGRAAGCDLVVENGSVSRRHAIVRFDGTRIYVRDSGARNPLRVNGRSIFGESPLAHGDVLGVGPVDLRVVTEPEAASPGAAPAPAAGAQTQVYQAGRDAPFGAAEPPLHAAEPHSAPGEAAPRWDEVAQGRAAPDWAAAAASAPRASPPPPPPPPHSPAPPPAADWSAMAAAPAKAPAPAPAWSVPAAAPPPAAPPPPAWDVPAAPPASAPPPPPPPPAPAPSWSPPPPVGLPPPPPPPPPVQFAAPPPPAIPELAAPKPAAPALGAGTGPAPKVVARRASSHKGWLVAGVVCMLVALTAGVVLIVAAGAKG